MNAWLPLIPAIAALMVFDVLIRALLRGAFQGPLLPAFVRSVNSTRYWALSALLAAIGLGLLAGAAAMAVYPILHNLH